ncbi:MAG: hypothetical protein HC893_00100 [Chloroflexaceae bacterium]|nr:hypothetical protein [Chloroflexaceae bacterium]
MAALAAPHAAWNGAVLVLFWSGLAVCGLAVLTAWLTWYVQASGWVWYERRLDDWHTARLEAFTQAQGQEVERQLSVWEFSDSSPGHMLLLMLAIQQRAEAGESTPHATRVLEGDVWLKGSGGRMLKVGYVAPSVAERAGILFANMGFIQGRKPKSAGRWVLGEQPIATFVDKWQ